MVSGSRKGIQSFNRKEKATQDSHPQVVERARPEKGSWGVELSSFQESSGSVPIYSAFDRSCTGPGCWGGLFRPLGATYPWLPGHSGDPGLQGEVRALTSLLWLQEVSLQSREEPLQLTLDTSKSVFFKPTRVGSSSTSLFTFHNPSRLPLEFEWRVSQQYRKMLTAQPARGLIQPNESLVSSLPHCPRPSSPQPSSLTHASQGPGLLCALPT